MSDYIIYDGVLYEYGSNELTHHGVKGMKWGVRKSTRQTAENVRRIRSAMEAASIERKQARIKRLVSRNKSLQKRYGLDYRNQNKRYRTKLKSLEKIRNSKISDLSEADIERGRAMCKTFKNVSTSVIVTAAAAAVGAAYAPAAVTAKLVGAGLATVLNSSDDK